MSIDDKIGLLAALSLLAIVGLIVNLGVSLNDNGPIVNPLFVSFAVLGGVALFFEGRLRSRVKAK
jgi:hypothetical protein